MKKEEQLLPSFELDSKNEKVWFDIFEKAKINTLKDKNNKGVIIEIAAQHPLKPDGSPGEEFAKRLDRGIELFNQLKDKEEVHIYVPGSCHDESGISLSDAGRLYLVKRGIPTHLIFGSQDQERIMAQEGVYNSFEECYVCYKLYKENNFRKIYTVCSPYQLNRKTLFYMFLGVLAEIIPVYADEMWHNPIKENFEDVPFLLSHYETYKEQNYFNSDVFKNARRERRQK